MKAGSEERIGGSFYTMRPLDSKKNGMPVADIPI
jgi:hypothetical protein